MKSSLRKLRGLTAHHRNDSKEKRDNHHRNIAKLDELEQASKDMNDMRDCYDCLFSAAAATANSAYEFSVALKDMGSCLLEKTAQNDDEESGRVLLMLGKAQFELQKLVDNYRSHIIQTITTPSESLLNELRTVEEMKRKCDEKRDIYDYKLTAHKEKSKLKNKSDAFSSQQLQEAQEEYEQEATLFIFRLKSLKQGQSRSLLTQAARHHAAQLNFFRKGNKSLEAIEPHVKLVAEQQHIDYQFSGLEDESEDDGCSDDANDDSELSFDYGQAEQNQEAISTSRNSMELDQMEHTSALVPTSETLQENADKSQSDFFSSKGPRLGSQSAPIFPEKKFDPAEKLETRHPSTKKFHTYILPTPLDCKSSSGSVPMACLHSTGEPKSWHSSPLGLDKHIDDSRDDKKGAQSVLKESNINNETVRVPPLAGGFSSSRCNSHITSDNKKLKRQAFSGPLTSKPWSGKPYYPVSQDYTTMASTVPIRVPTTKPSTSPKVSPTTSPPLMSSPKISELHELPRPPLGSARPTRPPSLIARSAPLVSRGPELSATTKTFSLSPHMASPLPLPPGTMSRSFSIPSSSQRMSSLTDSKFLEAHRCDMSEDVASPPLMPITLTNLQSVPKASELD